MNLEQILFEDGRGVVGGEAITEAPSVCCEKNAKVMRQQTHPPPPPPTPASHASIIRKKIALAHMKS
jgi:hypothetical protein